MNIPDSWAPTGANIENLPLALRRYVRETIRENFRLHQVIGKNALGSRRQPEFPTSLPHFKANKTFRLAEARRL
jgi:hypothetical protein